MLQPEPAFDPAINPSLRDAQARSLNDDVRNLAQDARSYAQAEFEFQKSRATYTAAAVKTIALFAVVAVVLVFFAVMALIVGLLLALSPLITPWGATAVVTLALLGLAVFLLLKAKRKIGVLMRVFASEPTP